MEPAGRVVNERQHAPTLIRQITGGSFRVRQQFDGGAEKSGAGEIMGEIQPGLQITGQVLVAVGQDPRPPVERIQCERFPQQRFGLVVAFQFSQHDGFEIPGAQVVGIETQRVIEMFQRGVPILAAAVNFRQRVIRGGLPRLIPTGFVKRVVGLVVAAEVPQAQAQIVIRLAVGGIGVAACQPFDGLTEIFFRRGEFAAIEVPQTERMVAARVQLIAAQRLAPIQRGTARGVAILAEVQAGDEKLVGAGNVRRRKRFGGRRRDFALHARLGLPGDDFRAFGVGDAQLQIRFDHAARDFEFADEGLVRRAVAGGFKNVPAVGGELDFGTGNFPGDGYAEMNFTAVDFQADRRAQIRVLCGADFLDGIPILAPRPRFARLEKTEVRLVVGEHAGHDFDIRREFTAGTGIGEVAVPGVAKFMVAPSPLFFAG